MERRTFFGTLLGAAAALTGKVALKQKAYPSINHRAMSKTTTFSTSSCTHSATSVESDPWEILEKLGKGD